jgi:hypothetical protein
MKAFVRASLLALTLLVVGEASRAQAWCCGQFNWCNFGGGPCHGPPCMLPWYLYYPYRAEFQTPAPMYSWPYWPTPVPAPDVVVPAGLPMHALYYTPQAVQPVGYPGPAPSYWYGQ